MDEVTGDAVILGHKLGVKSRTTDIRLDEDVSFHNLGLSSQILKGLKLSGFERPSPIQLSAIPLGRCGLDLVVQAKSGTGKTCVFTIVALDSIDTSIGQPQVLVLTPTREIALQIKDVFCAIARGLTDFRCHACIGGLPLAEDKRLVKSAHVIIGTPGRIKQLMELNVMNAKAVRLFILDEADKLLEESFQQQINWIYTGLPDSKQMVAASATYTEELVTHLSKYMQNPTFVRLNSSDPVLIGVRQYQKEVQDGHLPNEAYNNKVKVLIRVLSQTTFQQCLIFSNLQTRAENLCKLLNSRGWPAAHIAGCQEQSQRIQAMGRLKSYDCRILISTDLTSRGIDAERIDLVINLDLPSDAETYLHRVGRAGRYGAHGAAVSLVAGPEIQRLESISRRINTRIKPLPDELPTDFIHNPKALQDDPQMVQVESFQIVNQPPRDLPGPAEQDEGTHGSSIETNKGLPSEGKYIEGLRNNAGVAKTNTDKNSCELLDGGHMTLRQRLDWPSRIEAEDIKQITPRKEAKGGHIVAARCNALRRGLATGASVLSVDEEPSSHHNRQGTVISVGDELTGYCMAAKGFGTAQDICGAVESKCPDGNGDSDNGKSVPVIAAGCSVKNSLHTCRMLSAHGGRNTHAMVGAPAEVEPHSGIINGVTVSTDYHHRASALAAPSVPDTSDLDNRFFNVIDIVEETAGFLEKPILPPVVVKHQPPFTSLSDVRAFLSNPDGYLDEKQCTEALTKAALTETCDKITRFLDDAALIHRLKALGLDRVMVKPIVSQMTSSLKPNQSSPGRELNGAEENSVEGSAASTTAYQVAEKNAGLRSKSPSALHTGKGFSTAVVHNTTNTCGSVSPIGSTSRNSVQTPRADSSHVVSSHSAHSNRPDADIPIVSSTVQSDILESAAAVAPDLHRRPTHVARQETSHERQPAAERKATVVNDGWFPIGFQAYAKSQNTALSFNMRRSIGGGQRGSYVVHRAQVKQKDVETINHLKRALSRHYQQVGFLHFYITGMAKPLYNSAL